MQPKTLQARIKVSLHIDASTLNGKDPTASHKKLAAVPATLSDTMSSDVSKSLVEVAKTTKSQLQAINTDCDLPLNDAQVRQESKAQEKLREEN